MNLKTLLHPIKLSEFKERYYNKCSFAILRKTNPFKDLFTLEEIENKLNESLSDHYSIQIITDDGYRSGKQFLYDDKNWLGSKALKKSLLFSLLENDHSFVVRNISEMNRNISDLCRSIETEFKRHHCSLTLYISPSASATKVSTHSDFPQHKIYFQFIGTTRWNIYRRKKKGKLPDAFADKRETEKYLERDLTIDLTPGSVLYMPPEVFHDVTPVGGPRVSLSFRFHEDKRVPTLDRMWMPIAELLRKNIAKDEHTVAKVVFGSGYVPKRK